MMAKCIKSTNPANQSINRPIFRLNKLKAPQTTHMKNAKRIEIHFDFRTADEWIKSILPITNQQILIFTEPTTVAIMNNYDLLSLIDREDIDGDIWCAFGIHVCIFAVAFWTLASIPVVFCADGWTIKMDSIEFLLFFRLDCLCVCVLCVRDLYLNPMCTSKMANTSAVHEHTRNVKVCFCHVTHEVQNYESPIKNMHKSCKLALCHPKQLLAILIKIFFVRKRKYCLNTQNHSDKQK